MATIGFTTKNTKRNGHMSDLRVFKRNGMTCVEISNRTHKGRALTTLEPEEVNRLARYLDRIRTDKFTPWGRGLETETFKDDE